ncbi:MAG: hypothetical protein RIR53_308, partial [Bacteroidota bacterium]
MLIADTTFLQNLQLLRFNGVLHLSVAVFAQLPRASALGNYARINESTFHLSFPGLKPWAIMQKMGLEIQWSSALI